MIARGFRPVAWVGAVGTAALGCYMLSLQVAAERADLMGLERRIVSTQQDIRSLQTELGTRGRLQQLEQWNADVLALSAPAAGQFLDSNISLARFDMRQQPSVADQPVRMASAETTAPPAPAPETPVRLASVEATAAPAQSTGTAPSQPPLVRQAGLNNAPAARVRTASAPARPASLLDDGTLRDLRDASSSERGTRD